MAKEYELLPDGGVRLHLPSGLSVRSALSPDLLEKTGYTQRVAPPEGRTAQLPPEAIQAMQGTARGPGQESTRQVPDVRPALQGGTYKTDAERRAEELKAAQEDPIIARGNAKVDEINKKYAGSEFVDPKAALTGP